MRRFVLLSLNVAIGVVVASAYAFVLRGPALRIEPVVAALAVAGWAGFVAGATVGVGAAVGPRPILPFKKCLLAQGGIVLSSIVGAFLGSLFPSEFSAADKAIEAALAARGVVIGSWVGAAVGTVMEIFHVYFMRRRPPRPQPPAAGRPK